MQKLSVVVLAKNEEVTIGKCLKQLQFADEIIVIDDDSTDRTVEIAKGYNAKIISKKLESFADQRNIGLELAKNNWVLFIDADEIVDEKLKKEILRVIQNGEHNGYIIKRVDVFLGKELKYGDVKDVWLLRLGNKTKGRWKNKVHEEWTIKGKSLKLQNPLYHYSHANIKGFLTKVNFYSTLRAQELYKDKASSNFFLVLSYPLGKFVYLYFLRLGFFDGIYGFVHASMMSFYSFLVRGKLYLLKNRNEKK